MMSVLLLAVAQQSPSNIRWLDSKKPTKEEIAEEARAFVASPTFDMMCRAINVPPEMLREIEPDTALRLFATLISNKKDSHAD